jgi:hypothetical protein
MLHSPFVCLQRHERVRAAELDDAIVGIRNPEADWLDSEHELDCQRLGLTDIILCEVLQGVQDDSTAADVERRLRRLEVFELVVSNWPLKLRGTTVFCELVVYYRRTISMSTFASLPGSTVTYETPPYPCF